MEGEDPAVEDGPGLTPVLPASQHTETHSQQSVLQSSSFGPPDTQLLTDISPDLFTAIGYFGLVEDSCFLQQMALWTQTHSSGITLPQGLKYDPL